VAVDWIENWGHYRDYQDLEARYELEKAGATTGSNIEILAAGGPSHTPAGTQAPRFPAPGALRFKGTLGTAGSAKVAFPVTSRNEYIVGFSLLWEGVNPTQTRNDDSILYLRDDAGNQPQILLELNFGFSENIAAGRGYIRVKKSTNSTVFFDSEDDADNAGDPDFHALQYNQNYWIELRTVISATVGEVELRVNGEIWYSGSGLDTKPGTPSTIDQIIFASAGEDPITSTGHGAIYRVSDIYVVSPGGGGNETGFLYPFMVDTLYPAADTLEADFTPQGGGTNVAEVDDNPQHDYDSTHNESNTNGHKDRFTLSGSVPESTFGRVMAVQVVAMAKDTVNSGAKTARVVVFENATEGVGTTRTLTESEWQALWHLYEDNPDTAVAWLMADVEAAEIGYELIS
jgi:hypothetical protein